MDFWRVLIAVIAPYLLGSISVAVLITKLLFRKDVRKYGSHNAGATNVARNFGIPTGIATLLGDFGKTVLSMYIGFWLLGDNGKLIAAAACFLGHCFPIYFRFKGGKGVAVAGCIALMLDWRMFLILLCTFLIAVLITKYVSFASLCCAVMYPISMLILGHPLLWNIVTGVCIALLVIFMHRGNIKRLITHTESKFTVKKAE